MPGLPAAGPASGLPDGPDGRPFRRSFSRPALAAAAQNKRASVHDSHLYGGTNARA
jgi:hypothetical protein